MHATKTLMYSYEGVMLKRRQYLFTENMLKIEQPIESN